MGSASTEVITIESDDEDYSLKKNGISGKVEGCYIKFQFDDSGQLRKENRLEEIVISKPVNKNLDVNEVLDTNSEESNNSTEAIKDKDNTVYECEDCNKKFTKRNSLLKHEKTHGLETFECDRCNKCFSQYASLQIHKQTHPPLECLKCYEIFSSQKDLKEHEETHVEVPTPRRRNSSNSSKSISQLNKFKCNTCKWECKNFNRLRKHSMKSHKILIFYCNFCNEILHSKDENEKHKDYDCPKKSFKCRNCLKRFAYDTALKRHRLTCDKKSSEESQTEDFCCCEPEEMEIID